MGSSTYTSVADFEADCRALIEAVDVSAENKGPQALTATTQPFDIEGDGRSLAHLLYDCYVDSGDVVEVFRVGELQDWSVQLDLMFRVATKQRRADVNSATRLVESMRRALQVGLPCVSWRTGGPPERSWVQTRGQNGAFLRLSVSMTAQVRWAA